MGLGALNSGPYVCLAGTLLTKLSPVPLWNVEEKLILALVPVGKMPLWILFTTGFVSGYRWLVIASQVLANETPHTVCHKIKGGQRR